MNAETMIAEAKAAGLQLTVQGGNLAIRGAGVRPAHLIEAIRSHKAEVIGVLQGMTACSSEESERSEERLTQGVTLPPADLLLVELLEPFSAEKRTQAIDQVMKQGKPAIGWCLNRANAYFQKFPRSTFEEQDAAAAWELLRWQGIDLDLTP